MQPSPNGIMRVLLVRPDSYVGVRLQKRLLSQGDVHLRLLVEDARRVDGETRGKVEVVEGDPLDEEVLSRAARGVDVACFPTRFLRAEDGAGERSRVFATRFRDACIREGVGRIVFLGVRGARSGPLKALFDVEEILAGRPDAIRTVCLRNDFIVGSGSLLFEVLRGLARNSPILLSPRWMETSLRVTGIADTLEYLVRATRIPLSRSIVAEIGLAPMRFREMLPAAAKAMGLRRAVLRLPAWKGRGSSFLFALASPLSIRLASSFIRTLESIGKADADPPDEAAARHFPEISPMPFDVAVARALRAVEEDRVDSRWTDSLPPQHGPDADDGLPRAVFRDVRRERFGAVPPERVFRAVTSIGGRSGWFTYDFLWRTRGFLDKLLGGFGIAVGRRTESALRVGDILDVWQVADIREGRRLLLSARMNVFGKAWLEFRIEGDTLVQTACHAPDGLAGRLYWYAMAPFHAFIFRDMIRGIVRRASESGRAKGR